jgi:iron complex transport system ATP-binding protein
MTRRPSDPTLRVDNLSVHRSGTVILNEVSWIVRPGEHWVILGANGSGKTSLLSALTGYLMPSSGEIDLLGERYGHTDWRELRKRVGLVSSAIRQMMADAEPALSTVVSGRRAMVDYWGKITPADRRRGRQILKEIECSALVDRPWGVLSQGERQRVLIGRALMQRAPLLILDEPCAGLDPAAREQFLQFLERIGNNGQGPTLVLVTHHVEEIMPLFSHVLLLQAGRSIAAGPRDAVLTSAALSRVFGVRMRLSRRAGRYRLNVAARPDLVI